MTLKRRQLFGLSLALLLMLMVSCAKSVPEITQSESISAVNAALGLSIAQVPQDFEVEVNEGDQLILGLREPTAEGQVVFEVRSPNASQNIPGAVKAHQSFIEAQDGGDYKGGQELISPLGTTFYSRGRYLVEGAFMEETIVFALHPTGDRMMTITYRYPAGVDSSVRVQQLFDVLAEVGGLESSG
jgi:hypothetical protein